MISYQRVKYLGKEHWRHILFFLMVGLITVGIYILVFSFLMNYANCSYKVAISIAYVLAVIFHFTANRRVTFRAHGHLLARQLAKYLVMVAINYVITLFVMHWAIGRFGLSPYLGIFCSIGLTVGTGYIMAKYWVFRTPTKF